MDFTQAVTTFATAGKNEALYILFPAGVFAIFLGGLAIKQLGSGYGYGLAGTLFLIAVIFFSYGYSAKNKYENWAAPVQEAYAADPQAATAAQIERMDEFNQITKKNFTGTGVIVVLALALIFFVKVGWLSGIATGLLYISFFSLMLEGGFSASKAKAYTEFLGQHRIELSVGLGNP